MTAAQKIEASSADIGGGMHVRRALPTRFRRTIGAWCFLDHFGPVEIGDGGGMRVPPHPHIGLQTVTWLLEGTALHRDSLGTVQALAPGQLNLMTSGGGIAHAEDSPSGARGLLHGLQLWIALPEARRHGAPAFDHYPALPRVERDGAAVTVLIGELLGERSPAQVYSPLVGADLTLARGADVQLPVAAAFEHGFVVAEGAAQVDGDLLEPGALLYLPPGRNQVRIQAAGGARLVLVGGEPFPESVLMWWNFVARTKDEIVQACRDWNAARGSFGRVEHPARPLEAPMPPWSGLGAVVDYP